MSRALLASPFKLRHLLFSSLAIALNPDPASANSAADGTGAGPNVTVTENADDTVTMSNGIASIVIVKKSGRLNSLTYTYNNNGTIRTSETLSGKGQYYYGGFSLGNGAFDYSLASDPASNGGNLADVKLLSTSEKNGSMEIHFSMLRGSPGFYSTATMTHRKQDERFEVGAWGVITRVPPVFNWLSADDRRNWFTGIPWRNKGPRVPDSPHEISVPVNGSEAGNYADKFIYSQDRSDLRAWGWSSVGKDGLNIGRWIMTNMEFSNGGPLKRDVTVYPNSELVHYMLSGEVGMGSDGWMDTGEEWSKTCGPWFMYLNHVPATVTDAKQAAHMLHKDAVAQADAEARAWPYRWFKHAGYAQASERGVVKGRFVINDPGNPAASAGGLWVGLVKQPHTYKGFYDFQKWLKPYQFWVKTAPDGTFSIPHVIADDDYILWAFGPGTSGTFQSRALVGGNPPFECNLPERPFAVSVKAGESKDLGSIIWTPVRRGPTVFELGIPNRKANEFRHGEDYWNPGRPPKLGYPTPVWGGQMEFPLDFPKGMTYTVGRSQWTRDWNYVLPAMADATGSYQPCTGTIAFDLAKAPDGEAQASLYLALAGNLGDKVIVSVNGTNLGSTPGVTGTPNQLLPTGFAPAYSDTSSIHFSDHGPFCDQRIAFPAKLMRAGRNTLTITMDTRKMTAFLMVDYLRLELPDYIPPAPVDVTAIAGNQRVLVRWPLVAGASSYRVLRSTSRDSGYAAIANDVVAPVCGSGPTHATFTDSSAANGTQYFYAVKSVNPTGESVPTSASDGATPMAIASAVAPSAPQNVKVVQSGHHHVALSWSASPGASYYSVWRATLREDGVGGTIPLGTTFLDDVTAGTSYTDPSPTDGRIYSYHVTAANAAGTSEPSAAAKAVPLPEPPAAAPASLKGEWKKFREGTGIALSWSTVPGATGYVIYRSTTANPTFAWPAEFLTALLETTYFDKVNTEKNATVKGLNAGSDYYYQVTAVNAAGVSPASTVKITAP